MRDLWAGYPGQPPAIEGITLTVPRGELVGLIGPNGAGKSTLFKAMLGLIRPLRGEVRAFGRPIADARADIAYMPQVEEVDWAFPVSVLDVVLMGRQHGTRPFARVGAADRAAAAEALERVGLTPYAKRQVGRLSGGQRRRVLMARAIARGARLLLLDEPFAGLDQRAKKWLEEYLQAFKAGGGAIVMATHSFGRELAVADRIAILAGGAIALEAPRGPLTTDDVQRLYALHAEDAP